MNKPTKKKKRGGQPKDNPASARFEVRATPEELDAYKAKAEQSGHSLSQWVRNALEAALNRKSK